MPQRITTDIVEKLGVDDAGAVEPVLLDVDNQPASLAASEPELPQEPASTETVNLESGRTIVRDARFQKIFKVLGMFEYATISGDVVYLSGGYRKHLLRYTIKGRIGSAGWSPGEPPDYNGIAKRVQGLRDKLDAELDRTWTIRPERGVGYKLDL